MRHNDKPRGECPFCLEIMQPNILEVNVLRRDKCECPLCYEIVYICRMPSCNNYAKGGDYYDDELCLDCQRSFGLESDCVVEVETVAKQQTLTNVSKPNDLKDENDNTAKPSSKPLLKSKKARRKAKRLRTIEANKSKAEKLAAKRIEPHNLNHHSKGNGNESLAPLAEGVLDIIKAFTD